MSFGISLSVTNGSVRRGRGGGVPWSPADLPGVIAIYDPSDLSTLYQNAAGTIPVTAANQPVGRMLDKSSLGYHMAQSVAAGRPTYQTDGTKHWLSFDGVDDSVYFASFNLSNVSYPSLFLGVRKTGTVLGTAVYVGRNSSTSGVISINAPDSTATSYSGKALNASGIGATLTADDPAYEPPHRAVISGIFGASSTYLRVNGIVEDTNVGMSGSPFTSTYLTIGARNSGGTLVDYSAMEFYGLVIMAREATPAEVTQIENWLNGRIGAY